MSNPTEPDIYDDEFDDVRTRNQYPANQPPDDPPIENPEGKVAPQTVDFKQPIPDELWGFNRPNGLLSIYDPRNPDRQLMDSVEQEVIEVSSPPILLYRLNPRQQNMDKLYGEAIRRDYAMPVVVYGNYEDPSYMMELTKFGFNDPETIDVWFNYNSLLKTVGDRIQVGDILRSYDGKLWEVMTTLLLNEPLWRAIHNNVKAIRLRTEGIILPDLGNISVSPNGGSEPNFPAESTDA